MTNLVGQQLGNYRIVRLLGHGGFADVYLGRHVLLETQAAIKVLHTKLTKDDEEGFLTEARILRRLDHPHIIRVLEFAVEDGSPFLIMEYAPNGTLRQWLPQNAPIPLDTIVSYAKQIASALQYAHDVRLIHRDVKPENLLVGKHHEVLLSDFGFVTISQSSRAETIQDIAGTMAYMAPEQIQAQPAIASDQYALGIVIYEWLCGQRPFEGTLEEIAAKHMSVAPPSLCERIQTLSPAVETVVLRALEKNPSRRFTSVQELAETFEQACMLGSEAALRGESLRRNNLSKAKRVKPEIAEPTVPISTAIAPPNLGFTFSNPSERGIASDARGNLEGGQNTAGMLRLGMRGPVTSHFSSKSYPVQALALSPDGKRVAFGGWDEAVYVCDIAEGSEVFTYHGHTDHVDYLAWSPDGTYVASKSNKMIQVWDACTRGTVFTHHSHVESISTLAWSPDSKRIATGFNDKTVQVLDITHENTLFTYRDHTDRVQTVAWSTDGKRIASSSWDGTVQVWEASTGSVMCTYHGHFGRVKRLAWSPDDASIVSAGDGMYDCSIQVWSATTRSHMFTAHTRSQAGELLYVDWLVDGTCIRVGYSDGSIEELDATTGYVCNYLNLSLHQILSERFVSALTWTLDGTCIAFGSDDRKVLVYNIAEDDSFVCSVPAAPVKAIGTSSGRDNVEGVQSITWSPDKQRIATAKYDTMVQVWDAATGNISCTYREHIGPAWAIAWSPDAQRIASASREGALHIWDTTTGDTICTCASSTTTLVRDSVAWSPDGHFIASGSGDRPLLFSGSGDGLVQVWDATNGTLIHTCRGHSHRVKTVAWSPDGAYFASGSNDTTVRVWDAASGSDIFTYRSHIRTLKKVTAAAWNADGTAFVIGGESGKLLICDATKDAFSICKIPSNPVAIEMVSYDEQRFGPFRQDMPFRARPIKEWDILGLFAVHDSTVKSLAWSPDSERIVSGGYNGKVHMWDTATATLIFTYREHLDPVVTVVWSPDGKYIASNESKMVLVLNAATGDPVNVFQTEDPANAYQGRVHHQQDEVLHVSWSPEGQRLAAGDKDGRIWIGSVDLPYVPT